MDCVTAADQRPQRLTTLIYTDPSPFLQLPRVPTPPHSAAEFCPVADQALAQQDSAFGHAARLLMDVDLSHMCDSYSPVYSGVSTCFFINMPCWNIDALLEHSSVGATISGASCHGQRCTDHAISSAELSCRHPLVNLWLTGSEIILRPAFCCALPGVSDPCGLA